MSEKSTRGGLGTDRAGLPPPELRSPRGARPAPGGGFQRTSACSRSKRGSTARNTHQACRSSTARSRSKKAGSISPTRAKDPAVEKVSTRSKSSSDGSRARQAERTASSTGSSRSRASSSGGASPLTLCRRSASRAAAWLPSRCSARTSPESDQPWKGSCSRALRAFRGPVLEAVGVEVVPGEVRAHRERERVEVHGQLERSGWPPRASRARRGARRTSGAPSHSPDRAPPPGGRPVPTRRSPSCRRAPRIRARSRPRRATGRGRRRHGRPRPPRAKPSSFRTSP